MEDPEKGKQESGKSQSGKSECGYRHVASMMATKSVLAIFLKFGRLEMLNLLSLQAELMDLEAEFNTYAEDNESGAFEERFEYSFETLRNAYKAFEKPGELEEEPSDEQLRAYQRGHAQYELLLNIRAKLKEYGS
jgi:hypothetical protein